MADYDPAIDGHCCQLCGAVFSAKKRLIQHLKVGKKKKKDA